jgi:glycogen operon protein
MTTADWADPNALAILLYLDGCDAPDRAADGTPLIDDDFLVLVNAWWQQLDFVLPPTRPEAAWQLELDSYQLTGPDRQAAAGQAGAEQPGAEQPDGKITVRPRSVVVLRSPRPR